MAKVKGKLPFLNFGKGLITETTGLNAPIDSLSVADNVTLNSDGSISSRASVAFDFAPLTESTPPTFVDTGALRVTRDYVKRNPEGIPEGLLDIGYPTESDDITWVTTSKGYTLNCMPQNYNSSVPPEDQYVPMPAVLPKLPTVATTHVEWSPNNYGKNESVLVQYQDGKLIIHKALQVVTSLNLTPYLWPTPDSATFKEGVNTVEPTFTTLGSTLYVAHPSFHIVEVSYDSVTDSFVAKRVDITSRDLTGVTNYIDPTTAYDPATENDDNIRKDSDRGTNSELSTNGFYNYNIRNAGWTSSNLTAYQSTEGVVQDIAPKLCELATAGIIENKLRYRRSL